MNSKGRSMPLAPRRKGSRMFSLLGQVIGTVVGTVAGIAVAPIAIALDISEVMVVAAIKAGCTTQEAIRDFYKLEP